MRVTKLRASNFKGRSFEHVLGPITVFHGANSAGKSARLEALQLALAGFVPGVPATPAGIAEAFGQDMTVGAIMEAGGVIRSYKRKARGGIEVQAAFDGLPEGWSVAPVAVDAQEYLSLPEKHRVRVLFKLAKLKTEVNASTVTAEIKNIKLEVNSPATEDRIKKTCAFVEDSYRVAMKNSETVQEWIIDLSESVRELHKGAADQVKRMNLTVQGITQIRAAQPPSEGSIQDVERKLGQARDQETTLTKRLAVIETELNEAQSTKGIKLRLETELAGPLADCRAKYDQAKSKLAGMEANRTKKPDVDAIKARQKEVVRDGTRIKVDLDAVEHRIEVENRQFTEKMAHDTCPFCKSKKQGWKDELVKQHEAVLADLVTQREAKKAQRQPLAVEFNELELRLSAADQQLIAWDSRNRQLTDAAVSAHNFDIALARREDALKRLAELQVKDVAELEKEHRDIVPKLQGVRDARSALDADRIRLSAERTEALQKIQAAETAQNTLNEQTILKAALQVIEELCEQLVSDSINPLMDKVNDLCGIIMPCPLEYRDGEIGWTERGAWISKPKQLGGARRTLLFAALSVALSEPGGIVILDEFRNLDTDNRRKVLKHFDHLIKQGVIGQVVLADPDIQDIANVKGVTFIKVE